MSAGYVKSNEIDEYTPKISELLQSGMTSEREIANKLGIDISLVFAIMKSRKLLKVKDMKQPITKEIKDQIIAEYKAGGIKQIDLARKYNISNGSVSNILKNVKKEKENNNMGRKSSSNYNRWNNKLAMSRNAEKAKQKQANTARRISENEKATIDNIIEKPLEEIDNSPVIDEIITPEVPVVEENEFSEFHQYFGFDEFKDSITKLSDNLSGNIIKVGLVGDRHDVPIDKFIFETTLDNDLMFDYDKQDEITDRFIINNLHFEDGKCLDKLVVYTTGIQCALGSVIKSCAKHSVDLVLGHYNSVTKDYNYQSIFGDNKDICIDTLFNRIKDADYGIYFYNCTQKSFEKNYEGIYTIKLCQFDNIDNDSEYKWGCIICSSFEDIWKVYPTLIKYSQANDGVRLSIFINKSKISNGNFIWGDVITKSYNFRH